MRHHGWASLSLLGLSGILLAQPETAPPQLLRVPTTQAARSPDARPAAAPLPLRIVEAESGLSLEDELTQLRRELQSFDAARDEVLRSTKSVDAESDRVAIQQRQELLDVLTKLATKGITRRSKPVVPSTPQVTSVPHSTSVTAVDPFADPVAPVVKPTVVVPVAPKPVVTPEPPTFPIPDDPVDPFALGNVLVRSGDYAAAEKAFAKVQPTDENRMMLKFLTATCLRKRSQWKPASDAFRVVAGSNQDPVLRDLAKWQLDNMAWYQQTESHLDQMRAERDKRTATSKSRSAASDAAKP